MVDAILGQTKAGWYRLATNYVVQGNTLPASHKLEDALALSVWWDINRGRSHAGEGTPVFCMNWVDTLFSNYTAEVTQR